ncbi:hypothetical protein TCDM_10847 [Trypanosoma cruzi Dm28c]|uniref:Uncharacterized protein n=1 Tax=Trypanosoma cruzi Dm28c TaxID=1416333 RepID=V5ALK2_TRYCR|nr:hypothetical protein TCDM_10847 [Trypanosoma cruzi Dm28c]
MRNFVCGNANAPRRVSHVLRIKVHGANVGAKIRRCVARGRPHNAHGASTHHTSHTRCSTPTGKETRAAHSLPLTPHGHGRRQQPPHAAASLHHKRSIQNPLQCASCVCACRNTEQRSKNRSRVCGETHEKCTAEMHGGNNKKKNAQTHDCTAAQAAAIHTIFIENKKKLSLQLTQTPSHKIIMNKKEIVHYCSTQI